MAGEHDFGDGDKGFGAGFQVGGFEQRLLFGGAIGRHHRQGVDEGDIVGAVDGISIGFYAVGLNEGT